MTPALTFILGIVLLFLFAWYFVTGSERTKRNTGTALTILLVAMGLLAFLPPFDVPKRDAKGEIVHDEDGNPVIDKSGKIALGIDLRGGTSFLLRLKPNANNKVGITADALDLAVEAIRKRVDSAGTSEPLIAPAPPDRILVQLPGVDPARIASYREALSKVAKLEFRMVMENYEQVLQRKKIDPDNTFIDPAYEVVPYVRREPGAYQKFWGDCAKAWNDTVGSQAGTLPTGEDAAEEIIVSKKTEITGDKVTQAHALTGQTGSWEISLGFNAEGGKQFADITGRMADDILQRGKHPMFAILMDNVVISAAGLTEDAARQGGIKGGGAIISGKFEEKEARNIASNLLNPLDNPVTIEDERSTSASLGQDAINSGIIAGLIGAGLAVLVTLLYYRFAGIIANLALVVFCILLFGAMAMFSAVLTLPGIAGILLTLGLAIDANVLIYERLREEQAEGKTLKTAIDHAYEKAFSAIFDANLTTLITAAILFWQATGPVKGFAVSLVIGVIASMFTALVVTRVLFYWGLHSGFIKRITMANIIPHTNFDFMGKRKIAIAASILVMLGSVGIFAVRGDKNFGVDFKGGTKITYDIRGTKPEMDKVRDALKKIGEDEAVVQMENSANQEFLVIRTADKGVNVIDVLTQKFPAAKFASRSEDRLLFTAAGEKPKLEAFQTVLKQIGEAESSLKLVQVDGVEYFAVAPPKNSASVIEHKLAAALPTAKFKRLQENRQLFRMDGPSPGHDAIVAALAAEKLTDTTVTEESSLEGKYVTIKLGKNRVTKALEADFPNSKLQEANVEVVGALVGKQLANSSLTALLLGSLGILIYVTIRFEFSFAIGALVALLHDIVITVGVFSLLGRELSLVIVGAVLTVAGYSVNDTIVVYDRIREGVRAGRQGSILQIMNWSVNEMLSRTILTGGVTLITTFALFFFGGPVLNDFALTILIGVMVGTYSSVFIAAPIVLWWSGRGGRDLKSEINRGDEKPVVPA